MKRESEAERQEVFERLPVPQALRVMIVPSVISQLIVLIYNMADTFYVGRTGNPYMVAGTSLILPVFNITLCRGGLAGVAGGALISRPLGQGKEQEARRVSVFSLYLAFSVAALFSLGMAVFMEPILNLLGAGENTFRFARQYALCVIVAGGIPTVLSNVLANLIRSVGRSKEAGAGIVLGGVLNIILDPLFMFVLMPDGYEVLGAGVATCLSNCVACLFFVAVLLRMGRGSVITFNPRVGAAAKASILAVFAVGVPSAVASLLMFLSFFTVYLFQAFGMGRKSLFLGVTRWLVFNIPMLFLLNGIFGMYGIVWSQTAADILTVALSFYVYGKYGPKGEGA